MRAPAIRLSEVGFAWPGGDPVFTGVDLTVAEGELVGLVGPNGSGKTTLLLLVVGLLQPTSGRVELFGRPPREARDRVAYVPQHSAIPADAPVTALDIVLLGRLGRSSWGMRWPRRDREAALAALARADCAALAERPFGTLSGGQRQRVLVARALAAEPRLLVLDEPTANVDARATHALLELLDRLREALTIVLVSHDLGLLASRASRIAWLHGRLELVEPGGDAIEHLHHHLCGLIGAPVPPTRFG